MANNLDFGEVIKAINPVDLLGSVVKLDAVFVSAKGLIEELKSKSVKQKFKFYSRELKKNRKILESKRRRVSAGQKEDAELLIDICREFLEDLKNAE